MLPEESMEILEISASLPLAKPTQPAAPSTSSGQGGAPPAVFASSNPFAVGAQEEAGSQPPEQSPGPVAESAALGSSSMMGGTGDTAVFGIARVCGEFQLSLAVAIRCIIGHPWSG